MRTCSRDILEAETPKNVFKRFRDAGAGGALLVSKLAKICDELEDAGSPRRALKVEYLRRYVEDPSKWLVKYGTFDEVEYGEALPRDLRDMGMPVQADTVAAVVRWLNGYAERFLASSRIWGADRKKLGEAEDPKDFFKKHINEPEHLMRSAGLAVEQQTPRTGWMLKLVPNHELSLYALKGKLVGRFEWLVYYTEDTQAPKAAQLEIIFDNVPSHSSVGTPEAIRETLKEACHWIKFIEANRMDKATAEAILNANLNSMPEARSIIEQEAGCTSADIKAAAKEADKNPTDAEKEAENYKKGHISVYGLELAIENAKGAERSGKGKDGKEWKVTMPAHYGYVKGTEGKDGDHVDVYIGDDTESQKVWVVDQVDDETKKFDEHKCLICFSSKEDAEATYCKGFSDGKGKSRIGAMTEMSVDEWKEWLKKGDTTKELGEAEDPKNVLKAAKSGPDEMVRKKLKACGFEQTWRTLRGETWSLEDADPDEDAPVNWEAIRYWNESGATVWELRKMLAGKSIWDTGGLNHDQMLYKLRIFAPKGWASA